VGGTGAVDDGRRSVSPPSPREYYVDSKHVEADWGLGKSEIGQAMARFLSGSLVTPSVSITSDHPDSCSTIRDLGSLMVRNDADRGGPSGRRGNLAIAWPAREMPFRWRMTSSVGMAMVPPSDGGQTLRPSSSKLSPLYAPDGPDLPQPVTQVASAAVAGPGGIAVAVG
jgi:hypothetical protein